MKRTSMRRTLALLVGLTVAGASPAFAQTVFSQFPAPGQSYVISSSPTADGGMMTTTYTPPRSSTVGSTLPGTVGAVPAMAGGATQYRPVTDAYGYPIQPTTPANPIRGSIVPVQYQAPLTYSQPGSYNVPAQGYALQADYVSPVDPNYGRAVIPTNYQVPANTIPAGNATVPAPTWSNGPGMNPYVGSPVRTAPNSGVVPVGYQTVGYPQTLSNCNSPANVPPSLGYGTYGAVPSTVPVNGNYKPLLPIQGLPNGTYVSQGLIGQPKAFVNGQPVRNFFRYVLP